MTIKQMEALPKHIAIIMDGNGRWAEHRSLPRIAGHKAGVDAVRRVIKACLERHIRIVTLFAFSSENWRRPMQEVSYLMDLFLKGLQKEVKSLCEKGIQLRFIGDRSKLNKKLCLKMKEAEQLTQDNAAMILQMAVDYGGQWDICQALQAIATRIERGELNAQSITPDLIANHLSFADLPNPDLFIRTSGETRISNFMLWQLAYTELYFSKVYWPDFTEHDLDLALSDYAKRNRRFGLTSQQLSPCSK